MIWSESYGWLEVRGTERVSGMLVHDCVDWQGRGVRCVRREEPASAEIPTADQRAEAA